MNLKEVKELIELISEKGFTEFEIERQGFRMRIRRAREQSVPPASPAVSLSPSHLASHAASVAPPPEMPKADEAIPLPASSSAGEAAEAQLHTIKSPIVGTFYRAPSPTSEPFVRIGDHVEPESVVCIIEAMKLMNEIQAEVTGEVVKIYVENGQPVEYGQPLFGIKT